MVLVNKIYIFQVFINIVYLYNQVLSIKYQHIFIKPYVSNKTLLVHSTIHFHHCHELNEKNKS